MDTLGQNDNLRIYGEYAQKTKTLADDFLSEFFERKIYADHPNVRSETRVKLESSSLSQRSKRKILHRK